MKQQNSFPVVEVWWWDHHASETNSPLTMEEIMEKCVPQVRQTIGYLIYETTKCIALAHTLEEDGTYTEIDFILKKEIKKKAISVELTKSQSVNDIVLS